MNDEKDENEVALQKFLLDINCLDELLPWTGKFNIFDVLKISKTELRHSNVLSWLLSANENHGLGDAFIKGILQRIVENDTEGKYDVFRVLLQDFYSFFVYREWNNIDILLVSDEEKTVIAIENKVGSGEHDDQLNRYRKILENIYPNYQRILVFLTPDGDEPSDEKNWGILSYRDIINVLDDICKSTELVPDISMMINNYTETLRRYVVDDLQLRDVCGRIYEKHKKALDLIFENRIDSRSKTISMIRTVLSEYKENGLVILDESKTNNSFIHFYTAKMDELMKPLENCSSSWGDTHVYRFWFGNISDDAFNISFELGGLNVPEEQYYIQQTIINLKKPNDKRKEEFRYKRIYTQKFAISLDETKDSLQKRISEALDKILTWQDELIQEIHKNV